MEPADTQLTTTSAALTSCPTPSVSGGGLTVGGASGGGTNSNSQHGQHSAGLSPTDAGLSPGDTQTGSAITSKEDEEDSSNAASSDCKSPGQRYVNLLLHCFHNVFFLYFFFCLEGVFVLLGFCLFFFCYFCCCCFCWNLFSGIVRAVI